MKNKPIRIVSLVVAVCLLLTTVSGCDYFYDEVAVVNSGVPSSSSSQVTSSSSGRKEWKTVVPKYSAEETANMINNNAVGEVKKLKTEKVIIDDYHEDYAFAHAPQIAYYNGMFVASWWSGYEHEDDCGQRVLTSYSTDFYNWSKPVVAVPSYMGLYSEVIHSGGALIEIDGTLYMFGGTEELDPMALDPEKPNRRKKGVYFQFLSTQKKSWYCTSTDGKTWSELKTNNYVKGGNNYPAKTLSGRYFASGSTGGVYTDDFDNIESWVVSPIDDAYIQDAYTRGANQLCEAGWYQTDDGVIHLLMRGNDGYLWLSESYDDAETWSKVYRTKFTNDDNMFYAGRLEDGRFYIVATPLYSGNGTRAPLMILLSEDGYNFSEQYIIADELYTRKKNGYDKGGNYGYEKILIKDGYMYCIHSLQKEIIEILRFDMSQIAK